MDALAKHYLDYDTIHFQDIAGKGVKQKTFNQIELEQASDYAAEDADITLQLHQCLINGLQQDEKLFRVYRDIEIPLIEVLLDVEQNGVLIDETMLQAQGVELDSQLAEIETEIFQQAGEVFNLGSPKQIQGILFDKLQLPILRKTPKGQPSTGVEFFNLRVRHPSA